MRGVGAKVHTRCHIFAIHTLAADVHGGTDVAGGAHGAHQMGFGEKRRKLGIRKSGDALRAHDDVACPALHITPVDAAAAGRHIKALEIQIDVFHVQALSLRSTGRARD